MRLGALSFCSAVVFALLTGSALADPAAIVKAHSQEFARAANECDVPAAVALYENDAVAIWPDQGQVARGKAAIEKMINAQCASPSRPTLRQISSDAQAIGSDYIVNVGMWDATMTEPNGKPVTTRVRTTEVLHKSGGKWRYLIDHASIGAPPPPPKE